MQENVRIYALHMFVCVCVFMLYIVCAYECNTHTESVYSVIIMRKANTKQNLRIKRARLQLEALDCLVLLALKHVCNEICRMQREMIEVYDKMYLCLV